MESVRINSCSYEFYQDSLLVLLSALEKPDSAMEAEFSQKAATKILRAITFAFGWVKTKIAIHLWG